MAARKRRPNNNNYPTDYESDTYLSDMPQQQPAPPLRSNEDLNLSVIRRHNPSVNSILSLAPYSVVYIFSPTTRQWEKNGVEGSLFVCQLSQGNLGEERYSVFVLNRRGLNNFDLPLTDGENVEITEEYVILKADEGQEGEQGENGIADPLNPQGGRSNNHNGTGSADVRIYGLWIYSEPPPNSTAETRTINAQLIHECATHAGQSLKLARERLEAMRQNGMHVAAAAAPPLDEVQASVAMGRQISLKDLFGQQRAQDDGWSVRAHNIGPGEQHPGYHGMMQPPPPPPPSQPQRQPDVLGALFQRAGLAYQGGGQGY
ncbi:Dcp1-like decapping [Penicillium riverlandense]|uniref:Dcp1-like decapping n=1 Tax=Penicillium riverlandense TaxID=1903569 RepID=UPI0025492113|nr:Dcp1-like decapping [Penicillium riverlandense]KAJ5833543.1 Dcp1-like decapping [Penicillium riverlandense]